jgi:lipoyl(octanoyl) transferase
VDDLGWEWLGRVPYLEALDRQRVRREAILAGEAPDVVWMLEHDPVVTVGRRGGIGPGFSALPVVETERGGLATYHGPGQIVGYLLVDVGRRGGGVRRTVEAVEQAVIGWLAGRGVSAATRSGYPGVWVGTDKICAVGLHFRRGVSMHGFALNLTTDLEGFAGFVPCGIAEGGVTSLQRVTGTSPDPAEVAEEVAQAVISALGRTWRSRTD